LSDTNIPVPSEFVDELPTTPDGKIKRKELKQQEYEKAKKASG
jgi:acyl-coenzyme A synthetase/AMP-(fatty) acid ligase